MSVNKREIKREVGTETRKTLRVQISRFSDASTELHEENVYFALIVFTVCLFR